VKRIALAFLLVVASSLFAQPSGQVLRLQGYPQHGYIEIPHDTLLDTPAMTVEAWVSVRDAHGPAACSSIAGKGYLSSWWLGICGTVMRSYFDGGQSIKTGGELPVTPDVWVHIAAVTDGTTRRHYLNGNLVLETAETAPPSSSIRPLRIGSDADWDYQPAGGIDDLRIWKVARTQDQIRQTMYLSYIPEANDTAGLFQSLEAWYRFEGNAMDSWRTHHGTIFGTGVGFSAAPFSRRHAAGH
jgi:Concanavalin A-like lectin/glucanases superfamily